jgi:hypothetical protein
MRWEEWNSSSRHTGHEIPDFDQAIERASDKILAVRGELGALAVRVLAKLLIVRHENK